TESAQLRERCVAPIRTSGSTPAPTTPCDCRTSSSLRSSARHESITPISSCREATTGRYGAGWQHGPIWWLPGGSRMLRAARLVTASVVSFTVILAASGWLYVIQPHSAVPGPAIADALPLDELSRRSAVPFLVFLAVWTTASLFLGLVARASHAERLTAGLMLGLGVGGWAYLQTGLSLLIVRQVPAHQAFHAAAAETAIYLPAVLPGAAGRPGGRPAESSA